MSYLLKLKLSIFFLFLLMVFFVYKTTTETFNTYETSVYAKNIDLLKGNYRVNTDLYQIMADDFYNALVAQDTILALLSEAKNTQNPQKKEELRQHLYNTLQPHYKRLQEKGLNIVMFTFEENKVFFRVHKPSKHSDDISSVRKMVVDGNKYKKLIRGFEEGKISHAFRNIYPLYYKGEYIGNVDIAFSSESLQNHISTVYGVHTHFLVKKSLFEKQVWTPEQNVNYLQSLEHEGYFYTKTASDLEKKEKPVYRELNHILHAKIETGMNEERSFALGADKDDTTYILHLNPLGGIKAQRWLPI